MDGQANEMGLEEEEEKCVAALDGQIVYMRPRKVVLFFDLSCDNGVSRVEVATRRYSKRQLHLGDSVRCKGFWEEEIEGQRTFHALHCEVTKAWDAEAASFRPLPPPLRVKEQMQQPLTGHCKSWLNQKRCPRKGCHHLHVPLDSAEYKMAVALFLATLEGRRKVPTLADDPFHSEKLRKSRMERVFAQWLVRTFHLSSESRLLDVAGGAGKLASELREAGVGEIEIVDPRTDHRDAGEGLVQTVAYFSEDFSCSNSQMPDLLVGLHPDEATDACILWSLKHNVSFAVVPCCVFAHLNQGRKLASGAPVRTYEDLVEYLSTLCDVEKAFLPVQGRNCILYRRVV